MNPHDLWTFFKDIWGIWGWAGVGPVVALVLVFWLIKRIAVWFDDDLKAVLKPLFARFFPGRGGSSDENAAVADTGKTLDDIRLTPLQLAALVDAVKESWNGASPEGDRSSDHRAEEVAALRGQLGIHQELLQKILTILGEKDIQPEQLDITFEKIMGDFAQLRDTLQDGYQGASAAIRDLKSQAAQALEAGAFEQAERYLIKAEQHQTQRHKQAVAATRAERARLKEMQLDYPQAAALWESAADLHPLEDSIAANYCNQAGLAWMAAGQYAQAEPHLKRALEIHENHLGPGHPDTAGAYNNLAELYLEVGRFDEAEPRYKKALAICKEHFGPNHLKTAIVLNNIAALYQKMGRFDEAEPLYERVLAIRKEILGLNHPDTAMTFNNLGSLCQEMGRFDEAESLYEQALLIRKHCLGPDHPDTAMTLNNLGSLCQEMGRFDEAESLYEQALLIRKHCLGPDHPDTAMTLNNLGSLCQEMGRFDEAESLYEQALLIRKHRLGPDHPDTAMTLNNLGSLHQKMGRFDKAKSLYEQALAICKKTLGPDHPNTRRVQSNLERLQRH